MQSKFTDLYKNQKYKESKDFFFLKMKIALTPRSIYNLVWDLKIVWKIEVQSPCVVPSETETFYQQSCIVRGGKNAVGVRSRPARASNAL